MNPRDSKTGATSCSCGANLGTQSSLTLQVGLVVGGTYTRVSGADNTTVTRSKARTGASVCAAGSLSGRTAAGGLAGASGSAALNVRLRASHTTGASAPAGSLTLLLAAGGETHTVPASHILLLSESGRQAVVLGNATIMDSSSPGRPVLLDGAAPVIGGRVRRHAGGESAAVRRQPRPCERPGRRPAGRAAALRHDSDLAVFAPRRSVPSAGTGERSR